MSSSLYQRHVARLLKHDGAPLSAGAQQAKLTAVSVFGKWLARQRLVLVNPAADIEMPKGGFHLPQATLTLEEVERVLAVPDVTTPLGLRDRAILETFYSTGIRRRELSNLRLVDLDLEQRRPRGPPGQGQEGPLRPDRRARPGLGRRVPAGRPAAARRCLDDEGALFLSADGVSLSPGAISTLVRHIRRAADIAKPGACHLFRHAMATLMLEGGADLDLDPAHPRPRQARRPPRSTPRCRSTSSRRSTPRPIPAPTSGAPATARKATTPTSSSRRSPASCTSAPPVLSSPTLRPDGRHGACSSASGSRRRPARAAPASACAGTVAGSRWLVAGPPTLRLAPATGYRLPATKRWVGVLALRPEYRPPPLRAPPVSAPSAALRSLSPPARPRTPTRPARPIARSGQGERECRRHLREVASLGTSDNAR